MHVLCHDTPVPIENTHMQLPISERLQRWSYIGVSIAPFRTYCSFSAKNSNPTYILVLFKHV